MVAILNSSNFTSLVSLYFSSHRQIAMIQRARMQKVERFEELSGEHLQHVVRHRIHSLLVYEKVDGVAL